MSYHPNNLVLLEKQRLQTDGLSQRWTRRNISNTSLRVIAKTEVKSAFIFSGLIIRTIIIDYKDLVYKSMKTSLLQDSPLRGKLLPPLVRVIKNVMAS